MHGEDYYSLSAYERTSSAGAPPRTLEHEVLLRSFAIIPTTVPIILPSPPAPTHECMARGARASSWKFSVSVSRGKSSPGRRTVPHGPWLTHGFGHSDLFGSLHSTALLPRQVCLSDLPQIRCRRSPRDSCLILSMPTYPGCPCLFAESGVLGLPVMPW